MESLERIKQLIANEPAEILRPLILAMAEENENLKTAIKRIEDEKARQRQSQLNIEEQIKLYRRKTYGRSKEDRQGQEKSKEDRPTPEEAELFAKAAFPAPDEPASQKEKRTGMPEKTFTHPMTAEELASESAVRGLENPSADQWQEIENAFDQVTTIQIIERSYEKQIHRKKKYKLKDEFNPDKDEKDVIVTAKSPAALLPGMNYSTEFVAS